jgi:hypothetical protein
VFLINDNNAKTVKEYDSSFPKTPTSVSNLELTVL